MKNNLISNEVEIKTVEDQVIPQVVDPDYGREFIVCHLSSSHGTIDLDQYAALEKLLD